jgi:hypothetical protein
MKKIIILCVLCAFVGNSFAQKETFDITTFTPPLGWKKQTAESAVQLSKEDAAKGTYCLITLYKAVPGTANSKENFDLAWESLVKEMVTVSTAPEMQAVTTENGWETQTGFAPFESDGNKGVAMLITASSFDKMVNMIILTNTNVHEKEMTAFLESVSFKKPATTTQEIQTPAANNNYAAILGTWGIGTTIASSYNMHINEGSIITQYTFNANGTYSFYIKTFRYQLDKLLLTRETGTYQLNGNSLTINPQKSVIEAWSKKDGTDNWGKLLTSQKKDLEKTTYRFTKHYAEVLNEWRIVLQANKETKRDGYYNGGTLFNNAWIYSPVTCKDCFIKLPN